MEHHHTCNRQIILTKWAMASITLLEYQMVILVDMEKDGKTIVWRDSQQKSSWMQDLLLPVGFLKNFWIVLPSGKLT